MAGVTATGFDAKSLETIKAELEEEARARISTRINTSTDSPTGQLFGIFADMLAQLWELGQAVWASQYRDTAEGVSLDYVTAITGTLRRAATRSTVVATVNVDPGTYAVGALVAHVASVPGRRFSNKVAVVNGGAAAASFSATFVAEDTGPLAANSGTLTTIATPVAGWNSVTNTNDAALGLDIETDDELRFRSAEELAAPGGSTFDAVRVDLLQMLTANGAGGGSVTLFENVTLTTNGDGLPGKSFEALVYDGTPTGTAVPSTIVGQAVWDAKPAGIESHGATTQAVVDGAGGAHSVKFTRPAVKTVWLEVDIVTNSEWASGNDALIQAALVELGNLRFGVGDDVILAALYCAVFAVTGVADISAIRAGFLASPVGTANLVIAARELARFDTSRISVST